MASVYEYGIDIESDTSPARIVRFCGRGTRVLELGAGPGSISRVLKDQKDCDVVCAEVDQYCVDTLRGFCEKVYQVDLNSDAWFDPLRAEKPFDHVVIADVLEHLYNPWRVLREAAQFLNENGSILLSIPHTGHKCIIASLMGNSLDYRDWGLLDRTHIRFFGIENIQTLINDAGLSIAEAQFVVRSPAMTEFAAEWEALSDTERDMLNRLEFGNVYQVSAKLVPTDRARASLILKDLAVEPPSDFRAPAKLIAFYLPQFHPIPENDKWWGKGFTEWANVTRATPLFENHYQPHLPADLGFYDLRNSQTRRDQIDLAKRFGIDAFCYYYYWFSGRRVLEKPLDDMLADKASDMPFCLCWANESWTRRWDGLEQDILLEQKYLLEDDEKFIRDIIPYLRDPRYLRHENKLFLIVYYPQQLPDAQRTLKAWRDVCRKEGLGEIFLAAALTFGNRDNARFGFDGSIEFPPHNLTAPNVAQELTQIVDMKGGAFEYKEFAECYLSNEYSNESHTSFRTVVPGWDNTARVSERGSLLLNSTPQNYETWLDLAIRATAEDHPSGDGIVFINAWNEWAEGAHLEPDRRYGLQFLEATLRAKLGRTRFGEFPHHGTDRYNKSLADLRSRLKDSSATVESQAAKIDQLETEALGVHSTLREVSTENDRLWHEIEEKNALAVRVGTEVRDMYQSISWRLTAPVRSILRLFGVK